MLFQMTTLIEEQCFYHLFSKSKQFHFNFDNPNFSNIDFEYYIMETQGTKEFQQYLKPLLDRVEALEQKNLYLESQLTRIGTLITPNEIDSKQSSNKLPTNTPMTTKKSQKLPPPINKLGKLEPTQKQPPRDSGQKKTENASEKIAVKAVKLQEKKQDVPNTKVIPNPKKDLKRQSQNGIVKTSAKELPKKEQNKKSNGIATPTVIRKDNDEKFIQEQAEEKTEIIVQVLDYIPETPQKEKQNQTIVEVAQSLPSEQPKVQPKTDVPISKPTNKQVVSKPAVINGKARVSANQNKGSIKKIEGDDKEQKVPSKKNIPGPPKIDASKSRKALKQNNKQGSILLENKEENSKLIQTNEKIVQ